MTKSVILIALFIANALSLNTIAATNQQKKMATLIDSIGSVYGSMYAPTLWKKEFSNWTLQAEVQNAKDAVLKKELTITEFHRVVNALILSMKDYHVSVSFIATESARLPFMVRGAEGRYFIVHIDRTKLPYASFPFSLGDEILTMNGKSVHETITELKSTMGGNTSETDQSLAEMRLTSRSAARAMKVPQGPVTLTFKKNGSEKIVSHQLIWDYKKEVINNTKNLVKRNFAKKSLMPKLEMSSDIALELASEAKEANLFGLGAKTSFIPALGTKIWSSSKEAHHDAYIYLNDKKELIGYVRIPKYGAGEKESLQFKEIIKKFQKTTDKLIIDQVNNPGGSVFYLYSLVSMLTDKPMPAPKHYMAINQESVMSAISTLKDLEAIKDITTLKQAMGGETVSGYPLTMNFHAFMKAYYQFIVDEWSAGRKLTRPYHLYGVDKILPHPEVSYTKPILLLVNELDFSGGDFFPAIMQDSKRATIMGVRTAGAGGYVNAAEIPNQLGVAGFRFTGSLADRVDHTPIENLGVTPEIKYSLTPADYQGKFKNFAKKINETINSL